MTEIQQKTYTKQQVEKATLDYFNGDKLARDVWIRKYCLKDENNYYELTPDDMHRRIARELARIESKYPNPLSEEQIYETLKHFKRIVPQGSPMSGIGNDFQVVSLSNCFVIGNDDDSDSYGGIFKIDQEQVQLMKRRGGVGHDLSHIRPKGSPVKIVRLPVRVSCLLWNATPIVPKRWHRMEDVVRSCSVLMLNIPIPKGLSMPKWKKVKSLVQMLV